MCCFQYKKDAKYFVRGLSDRLARHGLEPHAAKARLIEFGRHAKADCKIQGQGKPGTFDFLRMTRFRDQSGKGPFRVGRKTAGKRINRTLGRITQVLRKRWRDNRHETARWLARVINGWLIHYAVRGSGRQQECFVRRRRQMVRRAQRRRSPRDRTEWEKTGTLSAAHRPGVRIRHPRPGQRLVVRSRGRSPAR